MRRHLVFSFTCALTAMLAALVVAGCGAARARPPSVTGSLPVAVSGLPSSPAAGEPSASSSPPSPGGTYRRPHAKAVYLDSLPGAEGDPVPGTPATRITGDVAAVFDGVSLGDSLGVNRFRVVGAGGLPVGRTIRLAGRDADEFLLYGPGCGSHCPRSGFRCRSERCEFGVALSVHRVGRIEARLLIGSESFRLTGYCLPPDRGPAPTSSSKHTAQPSTPPAGESPAVGSSDPG